MRCRSLELIHGLIHPLSLCLSLTTELPFKVQGDDSRREREREREKERYFVATRMQRLKKEEKKKKLRIFRFDRKPFARDFERSCSIRWEKNLYAIIVCEKEEGREKEREKEREKKKKVCKNDVERNREKLIERETVNSNRPGCYFDLASNSQFTKKT